MADSADAERIACAMVLAAGLGTRLRPLSLELPKPLFPVGDAPQIAHILERLRAHGIERIVANAFWGAEHIEAFQACDAELRVVVEPELYGTAGGLWNARERLGDGPVLVWNSDAFCNLDIRTIDRPLRGLAELVVVEPGPHRPANIGLDDDGRVVRMRAERLPRGHETKEAHFAGIHVLSPELRQRLPRVGCLVGDVYLPALREGGALFATLHSGTFVDAGTPARYLEANLAWLALRGESAFVAPHARVAPGVELTQSVVLAGARVEGEGVLERSVVWPGAVAVAPASGRIFAGAYVVEAEGIVDR